MPDKADNYRDSNDWNACDSGELTKLARRLDARHRSVRRRQILNTALVSTIVFACVVLTLGSLVGQGGTHYGGIPCSVCRNHLEEYQLHLVGDAQFEDEALLASMKIHLTKCPFCKSKFNALYPEQRISQARATKSVHLFALQPLLIAHEPHAMY